MNRIFRLILIVNILWISVIIPANAKSQPKRHLKISHITRSHKQKHNKSTRSLGRKKSSSHKAKPVKLKYDYNQIILSAKAYSDHDLPSLNKLHQQNPDNLTISYLLARANLAKNDATQANNFIHKYHANYLQIDLIHKLMSYALSQNDYPSFINLANLLPAKQLSDNETCTYNYIKTIGAEKSHHLIAIDLYHINLNKPIASCASLAAIKFEQGTLTKNNMAIVLDKLVLTKQYTTFNDLAKKLNLTTLNFNQYINSPISQLPKNKFLYINRIGQIAYKNPEQAFNEIQGVALDKLTFAIIYNHIAMEYARNQQFSRANALYTQYKNNYLSDYEYEWYLRTLLYYSNWSALVKVINASPHQVKDKEVWKYWLAMAYIKTHHKPLARRILKRIPSDYSYYSMLAMNELQPNIYLRQANANLTKLPTALNNSSENALAFYDIGLNNHLNILTTLGSRAWTYLVQHASNNNLLRMSNLARKEAIYDLAIKAGLHMSSYYINLIYPMPFLEVYLKYAKLLGIDPAYALAITRQESRFNHKVVAFDGGVGLMQIMPQTSQYIASKLKQNDCYDISYQCNILFGSWYLSNLYTKFPNIIYATGAYNAGPSRARKWQDTLGSLDNKIQIELIPIDITRNYVQNVLANKAIYMALLKRQKTVHFSSYIASIKKIHYLNTPDDDHTDSHKITK